MSEEVALAAGDIAYWQQRTEAAEADAAGLMNLALDAAIWIDQLASVDGSGHHDLAQRLREILDTRQYSGRALLAELAAARAVITAARSMLAENGIEANDRALLMAVEAYDVAMKAGSDGR